MATLKIESGSDGKVWVTLTRFTAEDLARLKKIAGHWWNPERKQWSFPDTPETRRALAEMVARPSEASVKMIAVKPKSPHPSPVPVVKVPPPQPSPVAKVPPPQPSPVVKNGRQGREKGRGRYVAGRDKPLTLNPPHPLIKQADDELVLRGMAYGTRKSYGQHLRNYFDWLKDQHIEPERATREDIRAYIVQMASSGLVSASYCRGARAALIFLYETVLKRAEQVRDLPNMKRPSQLPIVLSREEVVRLFKVTNNLKHRALLMTAYSAGLRVGEVVRLKIGEIDSGRMQIRVTAGKGAKDRYVPLSPRALEVLREYYKAFKPKHWLFPGDDATDHLSERAAQHVFEDAKTRAGIKKKATFHTLRHSYATHLHEEGVDIRYIQELMGHESIKTTELYTHVAERETEQIKSPLDNLKM
jgi:site-specific recombinase XerD